MRSRRSREARRARETSELLRALRLFGIDIHIDASWLFIFALLAGNFTLAFYPQQYQDLGWATYAVAGLTTTLLYFGSVLFHELSHSLVAMSHGVKVERITLFIFGGMSQIRSDSPHPRAEIRIAAAGPLASFALGVGLWVVSRLAPAEANIWAGMALYLAQLNVILALFNLLPGIPLDGGRLMRAALWWRSGDRWGATRVAAASGRWLGWSLIAAGIMLAALLGSLMPLWLSLLGLFLKSAADVEGRQATASQLLTGVRVDSVMTRDPVSISWRASVQEALQDYFVRYSFGGFPVMRDAQIVGVVSLADLARCPPGERNQVPVARVMTSLGAEHCLRPEEDLAAALQKMAAAGVTRLPVVDDTGTLAGLIALHAINRQVRIRDLAARGV